jgi:hypothetical protein
MSVWVVIPPECSIICLVWSDIQSQQGAIPEVALDLVDTCSRFDPQFEQTPSLMDDIPLEWLSIGGLGLFLVKTSVGEA